MNNLIPFESKQLPARFANRKRDPSTLPSWATGGGFPAISIKGKVFTIVRGDERTLVTQPGDDESPASSLEVVILKSGAGTSKVYYAEQYVEGSDAKPTCYSNNGIEPAKDATEPQAKKCATCAHAQWGSRITNDGKKAKACSDSVRMAIAPAGNVEDAMLLRVPATSIAALRTYYNQIRARGAALHDVVTKIGFDYTVAHPALTFRAVGFVSDEKIGEVLQAAQTEIVGQIIGEIEVAHEAPEPFEQPAPKAEAPAPKKAVEEKPKVKKSSALASAEAAADEAPPAKVKVEAAPKATPTAALEAELEAALEDLDFED